MKDPLPQAAGATIATEAEGKPAAVIIPRHWYRVHDQQMDIEKVGSIIKASR